VSTVLPVARRSPVAAVNSTPRLALLGTGTVGRAFVTRYTTLQERRLRLPRLEWLANSRVAHKCGVSPEQALQYANAAPRGQAVLQPWAEPMALRTGDVLVDATASDVVADWHVEWLLRGVHAVTASKLGLDPGPWTLDPGAQHCMLGEATTDMDKLPALPHHHPATDPSGVLGVAAWRTLNRLSGTQDQARH